MSSPAPLPRRTQAERRAESERNLLLAAAALVAEEGVAAATLERVGARAGYSRGLATQKFGSKQGLIEALIAHLHTRMEEQLQAAHPDSLSGQDAVLAFVDLFLGDLGATTEVRAYFMLLAGTVADRGPSGTAFAGSHDRVRDLLAGLIARGQADGSLSRAIPPADAATLVGTMLLGLALQSMIDAGTSPQALAPAARHLVRSALAA